MKRSIRGGNIGGYGRVTFVTNEVLAPVVNYKDYYQGFEKSDHLFDPMFETTLKREILWSHLSIFHDHEVDRANHINIVCINCGEPIRLRSDRIFGFIKTFCPECIKNKKIRKTRETVMNYTNIVRIISARNIKMMDMTTGLKTTISR